MLRALGLLTAAVVVLAGCAETPIEPPPPPPPPFGVQSISPNRAVEGSPDLLLTVRGSDFDSLSDVVWVNGPDTTYLATTFVNAGVLTARVSESLLVHPTAALVFVVSPDPSSDTPSTWSDGVDFTIAAIQVGRGMAIAPNHAHIGSPEVKLTVSGSGFAAPPHHYHSQVFWVADGDTTVLATSFVSSAQLRAVVPAELLGRMDTAAVFVLTGDPMGDTPLRLSGPVTFVVTDSTTVLPPITITPGSAPAGSSHLTLTIDGSGFAAPPHHYHSQVVWATDGDTTYLATSFLSTAELSAFVPAKLLAAEGSASVFVLTGDPMGETPMHRSGSAAFRITGPGR
jgi:hypothetical protein